MIFYLNIPSQVQDGPSCGLIALEMCSRFFGKLAENVSYQHRSLDYAINKGYTLEGEMFSAFELADVARSFYGIKALVDDVVEEVSTKEKTTLSGLNFLKIISHILKGLPVIIPYDNDKNNYPCLRDGGNAHWGIIFGFILPVKWILFMKNSKEWLRQDERERRLYHINSSQDRKQLMEAFLSLQETRENHLWNIANELYVFGQQSRSRHRKLWNFELLLQSNCNLFHGSPEKRSQNRWKIPEQLIDLRGKVIFLFGKE